MLCNLKGLHLIFVKEIMRFSLEKVMNYEDVIKYNTSMLNHDGKTPEHKY